jgi:hypothetical protein
MKPQKNAWSAMAEGQRSGDALRLRNGSPVGSPALNSLTRITVSPTKVTNVVFPGGVP